MGEERSTATFLDELLQDPSTMVQYLELLDENRVSVIRNMHQEWLNLLDRYRTQEYTWLTMSKVVPHVRQKTKTKETKSKIKTKTKTQDRKKKKDV
jgi:hypothetical protein